MTARRWLILCGLILVLAMGLTHAAPGTAQPPVPVSSPPPMPHKAHTPPEVPCGPEGSHDPLQKSSTSRGSCLRVPAYGNGQCFPTGPRRTRLRRPL